MMRRTLLGSLAGSLMIAATVLGASPAAAANTTIVSRFGVPAPLAFHTDAAQCGAGPSTATVRHIHGPATPPLGSGSLQVAVAKDSAADITADLSAGGAALGDLTALSTSSYVPTGSGGMQNFIQVVTQPNGSNNFFQLKVQLPTTPKTWNPFDALNSDVTFAWTEFNTNAPNTSVDSGTSTYDNFAAGHSNLLLDTVGATMANCGAATHVLDLDKFTLGLDSSTTVFDFEAPIATKLRGHTSSSLVGYRKAVTPSATLTTGGKAFKRQSVTLWAKPAGAKAYHRLASIVTNPHGVAVAPVQHPRLSTDYLWRYPGNHHTGFGASTSKPDTVAVRSKVRLDLERRSVPKTEPVAGGGSVTPRHAGLKVTLWAQTVTGTGKHQKLGKPVKVMSTKLRRDGTYTVSGSLAPGTYRVFTTAAADKHNATGRSAARKFIVRA